MLFRQLLHEPLASASYLLGCPSSGEAVVVDPCLPAERYALLAADHGMRIVAVLETHMHADYISTGRATSELCGAQIFVPRHAEACFAHMPVDDGWELRLGNVRLRALYTPGHTPEHTAYLVSDLGRSSEPWCVLTGDCLFVGDVGRADLLELPMTGAAYLYESVQRLLELPDDVEVYPTHYGGSACGGKGMSGKPSSTIGYERRHNPFAKVNALEFAALLNETPRAAVQNVLFHRNTNRGEIPLPHGYGTTSHDDGLPALSVCQAATALREGVTLVDVRDRMSFAKGHATNALNITFNRSVLADRVAALTTAEEPIAVLADRAFLAREVARLLAVQGRNPVVGFVEARYNQWHGEGLPESTLSVLSVADLHAIVEANSACILDVRDPHEQAQGTIEGALLIPFAEVRKRLSEIPCERSVVVVCESGIRAVGVASMLKRLGWSEVAAVAPQGMSEYWRTLPIFVE